MQRDMQSVGDKGHGIISLKVDGGASANKLLMQFQSDISGIDVALSGNAEATARGAAFLAGLAVGFYCDRDEIRGKCKSGEIYSPKMDVNEREKMLRGWNRAIKACRAFCEDE